MEDGREGAGCSAIQVIEDDPVLTANLLRHFNDPQRKPNRTLDSLRIIKLLYGENTVVQTAIRMARSRRASPVHQRAALDLRVSLLHAYAGADLARFLAIQFKLIDDPDRCFSLALLRNIGWIAKLAYPALTIVEEIETPESATDAPTQSCETPLSKFDTSTLGVKLVNAWDLPEAYGHVIASYSRPDQAPAIVDRRLLDVVHIADARSRVAIHEDGRYALMQTIRPESLGRTKITIHALENAVEACVPNIERYWVRLGGTGPSRSS